MQSSIYGKLSAASIKCSSFGFISMGLHPLTITKKERGGKKAGLPAVPIVGSSACRRGARVTRATLCHPVTIQFPVARSAQCRERNLEQSVSPIAFLTTSPKSKLPCNDKEHLEMLFEVRLELHLD